MRLIVTERSRPQTPVSFAYDVRFSASDDMRKGLRKAAPPKKKPSKRTVSAKISEDDRKRRVAEIAYSLGARRGFEGDTDAAREDWLEAERIFDSESAKSS